MTLTRKRLALIVGAVLVLIAAIYGFWPDPVQVDTATAERDSLRVILEEEGRTEVQERYMVSAPVAGVARRIEVEPGDYVEQGQPVVQLEPPRASLLDPRTRQEAQARAEAAQAAVAQAERQVEAAEALAEQAQAERERMERLAEQGSATPQAVAQARSEALQAEANLEAARAAAARARADLQSARATLQPSAPDTPSEVIAVLRTPEPGRVLAVHRSSGGPVSPGEVLLEVGDTQMLEIRVDVLSQDAMRIEPGTRILLDQWGGERLLEAEVQRVEPQGRTSVSALGVEEQRVTVVAHPGTSNGAWASLGAGYRVLARFILWEEADVLQVPTSAVFRTEEGWAVFVVEGGVANKRPVTVGQQSGLTVQIISGLEEGDEVIVHPSADVEEGIRVTRRET